MRTYLLTFNPKHWLDSELVEHKAHAEKTAEGIPYEMRWSTGNSRNVQQGDGLFIVREGLEPKGIFAAG